MRVASHRRRAGRIKSAENLAPHWKRPEWLNIYIGGAAIIVAVLLAVVLPRISAAPQTFLTEISSNPPSTTTVLPKADPVANGPKIESNINTTLSAIPSNRSIALYNVHTGEWVRTVYWSDGHYIAKAMQHISWILRDHHTDEAILMDTKLIDFLASLYDQSHEPFEIVGGYIGPSGIKERSSLRRNIADAYTNGRAVSVKCEQCMDILRFPRPPFMHAERSLAGSTVNIWADPDQKNDQQHGTVIIRKEPENTVSIDTN